MKTIVCSVDTCNHDATTDIWTDCDRRAWLCDHHHYVSLVEPVPTFTVGGKTLMRDTAGCFWYFDGPDPRLQYLAKEAGLAP